MTQTQECQRGKQERSDEENDPATVDAVTERIFGNILYDLRSIPMFMNFIILYCHPKCFHSTCCTNLELLIIN